MKNLKKGQNLVEYMLIFMLVAVVGYVIASGFDLKKIRNYVLGRPMAEGASNIRIEPMTE